MRRALPTAAEAAHILAARRTRPRAGPPPPAAAALRPMLAALGRRFGPNLDGLKARWTEIAGEQVARNSEPARLTRDRNGEAALTVRVDGPSATLIQHQASAILERVNLFLGPGAVTRMRVVQGPIRRMAAPPAPARRLAGPLDAAAEKALAQSLAAVPDGPLKDALARLGRGVMRRSPP